MDSQHSISGPRVWRDGMKSINEIWNELAYEEKFKTGFSRRRIPMRNDVNLFATINNPSGLPALLLESDIKETSDLAEIECLGFTLKSFAKENADMGLTKFIILELSDNRFRDVFNAVADDIIKTVAQEAEEKHGVVAFTNQILKWKNFFDIYGTKGLSKQLQHGLWGELWVIKSILSPIWGLDSTILSWVGPGGANQDFSNDSVSLEVKTSISPPHKKFVVSNILQLIGYPDVKMFLIFIALDVRRSKTGSLPQLVKNIRDELTKTNPHILSVFNNKLISYGYMNLHEEKYLSTGYHVRSSTLFQVVDGFPRLLEDDIPSGVGDLKYSVSISSCLGFTVDATEFSKMIGNR